MNCANDDERLFLQFNTSINVGNKLQKIIGFAHPDLINIIKGGPVHLFIDCTFKCVPKGFSQCLVIMIYDYASSLYIPVFYILLQSKLEEVYSMALYLSKASTDFMMEIINGSVDFEKGLVKAIKRNFEGKACFTGNKRSVGNC